jgi:hypothetical protein
MSSLPVFNGVRVSRALVLYVDRCQSFYPYLLAIVLFVLLRFTDFDYLPLTKFKYFFTGIYLCCSNIYNIFIKYIVLYDEIHLKYCRNTVAEACRVRERL